MEFTKDLKAYISRRFVTKYHKNKLRLAIDEYKALDNFNADENVFEKQHISEECHFLMRILTQYHIENAFKAMKINLDDPNVYERLGEGNIGTPARIAKVWCGENIKDLNELGSGRWAEKPRLAKFPNKSNWNLPITKKVDVVSNCSHHFIPFTSTGEKSYAIISYIPKDFVLGISKLQRLTDWIARRYWLQEDLTKKLYEEISQSAETESVYIRLHNMVHGCETLRGTKSSDGSFTTEYYGGLFKNPDFRKNLI